MSPAPEIPVLCLLWRKTLVSFGPTNISAISFFAEKTPGYWSGLFKPDWINNWDTLLEQRVAFIEQLYPVFSIHHIYPWKEEISRGIDLSLLSFGEFTQPDLFIRIRPGHEKKVREKLRMSEILFDELSDTTLAFTNGTKLDTVLEILPTRQESIDSIQLDEIERGMQ